MGGMFTECNVSRLDKGPKPFLYKMTVSTCLDMVLGEIKKALRFESAVRAVESSFSKIPFLPFLRNLAFLHIEEFWSPIENLQAVQ